MSGSGKDSFRGAELYHLYDDRVWRRFHENYDKTHDARNNGFSNYA